MTTSETERIAREFIRVWTPGNLELLGSLADPDILVDYPHFEAPVEGADGYRAVIEESFRDFPDLETTLLSVVAGEDRAAVEWEYEGTHRAGTLFGVEPAGARVRVRGMCVYEMRGGRVVEERGVADILGLMTQLGALEG